MKPQYRDPIHARAQDAASLAAKSIVCWCTWLEVEDLQQEALCRIYDAVRYNPEYHERSWNEQFGYLLTVARSACIDHYRRNKRHHEDRAQEGPVVSTAPSPESAAADAELHEEVRDILNVALARMSGREIQALEWWLGFGQRPKVAHRTLYTYLERARTKLQQVARWRAG